MVLINFSNKLSGEKTNKLYIDLGDLMGDTQHEIFYQDATNMQEIDNNSIDLIVTSPPYPMIEMWDDSFAKMNPAIKKALTEHDGKQAFELMHKELNQIWEESYRVLKEGGVFMHQYWRCYQKIGYKF